MSMKEILNKMQHATQEQKEEIWSLWGEVFETIEIKFPKYYQRLHEKMEMILDDEDDDGMTEHEAKMYVSEMVNKDGTEGEHFDCATVKRAIEMYPELKHYPFWAVYYVMNMMYSDYYDSSFTTKTYIKLTKDFLDDKDAPKHKALIYAKAMHK